MSQTIHEGRNIKRFREMLGIKQEGLAYLLPGEEWNQQKISLLEAKEKIDPAVLQDVSAALKIPVEAFQNFNAEQAIHIISNTVNNSDNATGNSLFSYYPTINPVEKWMEAMDKNEKLYERLLQTEREKVALLQNLLDRQQ